MVNKSIVIGGADGFLGRHAARHFAAAGYNVFGTCMSKKSRSEVETFFSNEKTVGVELHTVNLAKETEVKAFAAWIQKAGSVSHLLNAAGGFAFIHPLEATEAQFDFLFDANVKSTWLLTKYFIPDMVRQKFGRLVFISAAASQSSPSAGMGLYVASKTAMNAMLEGIAEGLTKGFPETNVCTNAICPTIIDTPRNRADMPDAEVSRWVTTSQIIRVVEELFDPSTNCPNGTFVRIGS